LNDCLSSADRRAPPKKIASAINYQLFRLGSTDDGGYSTTSFFFFFSLLPIAAPSVLFFFFFSYVCSGSFSLSLFPFPFLRENNNTQQSRFLLGSGHGRPLEDYQDTNCNNLHRGQDEADDDSLSLRLF
jgi:hypothetical protein